ncbi:hypothetical protein AB834_01475 [PVC group bacterium (ex Bugula neritina AB1)]|nr:hypothetical protein AB834_01475 [PVC group bacterium (ex Bugula neritina AB1)]
MQDDNLWKKALEQTEIIRPRIAPLSMNSITQLPYIFLASSSIHPNTTIVRKGHIDVEKPSIILPPSLPQFEGFELYSIQQKTIDFLLIRGIRFPSLKYLNHTKHLDIYDGDLEVARSYYLERLQAEENIKTGLISGLEDSWQHSVLIFICKMASRSAQKDISDLIQEFNQEEDSLS